MCGRPDLCGKAGENASAPQAAGGWCAGGWLPGGKRSCIAEARRAEVPHGHVAEWLRNGLQNRQKRPPRPAAVLLIPRTFYFQGACGPHFNRPACPTLIPAHPCCVRCQFRCQFLGAELLAPARPHRRPASPAGGPPGSPATPRRAPAASCRRRDRRARRRAAMTRRRSPVRNSGAVADRSGRRSRAP